MQDTTTAEKRPEAEGPSSRRLPTATRPATTVPATTDPTPFTSNVSSTYGGQDCSRWRTVCACPGWAGPQQTDAAWRVCTRYRAASNTGACSCALVVWVWLGSRSAFRPVGLKRGTRSLCCTACQACMVRQALRVRPEWHLEMWWRGFGALDIALRLQARRHAPSRRTVGIATCRNQPASMLTERQLCAELSGMGGRHHQSAVRLSACRCECLQGPSPTGSALRNACSSRRPAPVREEV